MDSTENSDGTVVDDFRGQDLLDEDTARWGDVDGVTVHDVRELEPQQVFDILEDSPGTVIAGFCNSEVCLSGISGGWTLDG